MIFVTQKYQRHNISEDTWQQLLSFSRCVNEDLEGYDPRGIHSFEAISSILIAIWIFLHRLSSMVIEITYLITKLCLPVSTFQVRGQFWLMILWSICTGLLMHYTLILAIQCIDFIPIVIIKHNHYILCHELIIVLQIDNGSIQWAPVFVEIHKYTLLNFNFHWLAYCCQYGLLCPNIHGHS